MSPLGGSNQDYAGDRGEPDAALRVLLSQAGDGRDEYLRAIAELCTARFLLPIMAVGDDGGSGPVPGRHAEMRAVQLATADGKRGLLVFTGLDSFTAWKPDARPVPCRLDEVASTAAETGAVAILVDLAGPSPLVIESGLIGELASGRRLVTLDDGAWGWLSLARSADAPSVG